MGKNLNFLPPEYNNETLFFCEKCSKAYLSKTQLTDHIYKVHYSKEKKSQEEQEEKSINATECKTCEKSFREKRELKRHYDSHLHIRRAQILIDASMAHEG